jgi:hypothetical protein
MDIILMVDAYVILCIVIGIQIFGVIVDAARQKVPGGSALASANRYFVKQPGAGHLNTHNCHILYTTMTIAEAQYKQR